jgi:DNA-binding GntR family transcriptional regulator
MLKNKKNLPVTRESPLRDHIQNQIRTMLIQNQLPPHSRIVESQLSAKLGVSRTPIREALFKLEQEGFIKSDLARGFTVKSLNSAEVKELYPIIWTLEGLAVQLAQPRINNILKELKLINQDFAREGKGNNTIQAIDTDTRFHEALTQECRNRHLIKQLAALKQLVLRYEFAYMQDANWVEDSIEQHEQIIEALTKKDFKQAVEIIEKNWRNGMDRISTWLDWVQAEDKLK